MIISSTEDYQLERRKDDILKNCIISETLTGKQILFNNRYDYKLDRKLIKKGTIKGKERFYDTERKRLVSKDSSGYVRAFYMWEFERRYKPHRLTGWIEKRNSSCKHRVVSVLDNTETKNFYTECKLEWSPYHIFIPVKIGLKPKEKKENIRHYYKNYGIPVDTLARIFILSERRIRQIIQDLHPEYKCLLKSNGNK